MSLEVVILRQIQGCKHPSYVPELTAEKKLLFRNSLGNFGWGLSGGSCCWGEGGGGLWLCDEGSAAPLPTNLALGAAASHIPSKATARAWQTQPLNMRSRGSIRAPLFMGLFPMWLPADQRLAQGKAAWLPVQPWTAVRAVGWDAWAPALCKKWRGEKSQVLRMKVHVKVKHCCPPPQQVWGLVMNCEELSGSLAQLCWQWEQWRCYLETQHFWNPTLGMKLTAAFKFHKTFQALT